MFYEITAEQGNSVAQDLPPTGSEANTTIIIYIYILDIKKNIYIYIFYSQIFFLEMLKIA